MMETELTAEELRVLACLIEKSFTTPDQYPLTTNSLTNACNQKTSREPVVDYPAQLVDQTMLDLRQGGWARSVRGSGNRAFKHKHVVDEKLGVSDAEMAVLAVLALRGPQSPGELRTRTERYGTFSADGDEAFAEIERVLALLASGDRPLVRNVGRASGQSQDRWIQLIGGGHDRMGHGPATGADSRRAQPTPMVVPSPTPGPSTLIPG
ncbi:MAG: YceH family protein, partial [Acidimicrobiia bacterium]|nr:YceH family protein [Acidimicrobiia bacterium]